MDTGRNKIPGSETKDYYSQHSKLHEHHFYMSLPCPQNPTGAMRSIQIDTCSHSELHYRRRILSLGNLLLLQLAEESLLFVPDGKVTPSVKTGFCKSVLRKGLDKESFRPCILVLSRVQAHGMFSVNLSLSWVLLPL